MRHRIDKIKLGRLHGHRSSMLANMVTSLFKYERIKTTDAKAHASKRLAERLISFAKEGSLSARRQAARTVRDAKVLKKLFETIGPRMKDKTSGFIQITKLWPRPGDNALLCLMELHGAPAKVKAEKGEKPGKAPAAKKPKEKPVKAKEPKKEKPAKEPKKEKAGQKEEAEKK